MFGSLRRNKSIEVLIETGEIHQFLQIRGVLNDCTAYGEGLPSENM